MTAQEKIHLYREMVRVRCFEQKCVKTYNNCYMGGWLILTIGQEALPVAVRSLMGPDDHTISGCRGLGSALASGMSMESIMAELCGTVTGCSQGKGGMFSLFSPANRHWGCYPIAAAQTPVALGLSFALKYQEKEGVVFCYLGDGAMNQGVFHETLNLAGLFDIPTVFLVENNGYAMGTSVRRSSAFKDYLAQRAEAYDIEWDLVEGWKMDQLLEKLQIARERALKTSRPTVLEVQTYRYYGFSIADANNKKYRTPEEIEYHKKHRDPLAHWKAQLSQEGILDEAGVKEIQKEAKAEAEAALETALDSPIPQISDIGKHVYWEVDHETPASQQGRYFFNDEPDVADSICHAKVREIPSWLGKYDPPPR